MWVSDVMCVRFGWLWRWNNGNITFQVNFGWWCNLIRDFSQHFIAFGVVCKYDIFRIGVLSVGMIGKYWKLRVYYQLMGVSEMKVPTKCQFVFKNGELGIYSTIQNKEDLWEWWGFLIDIYVRLIILIWNGRGFRLDRWCN